MNKETPKQILEILFRLYGKSPTAVLPTYKIAEMLKISMEEAQGGCIYLKEKDWIKSFQRFDDQWVQKINANGIDELNKIHSSFSHIHLDSSDGLEMEIQNDDFEGIMKVFISHKFVKEDQKYSLNLQEMLREKQIRGYLAERKRNYELLITDKIKNEIIESDFVVGIVTKNSQNSASVNQELGFALGKEIPVILLVEKGIVAGVLTHGRETEEFTEETLIKSCNNVIDYLLEKGPRKKQQFNDNEIIESTYRPLYNSIIKIQNDKFFMTNKLESPWKNLDEFSKFKIDKKMNSKLNQLHDEIMKWNMMGRQLEREFSQKQHDLGEIFKECFLEFEFFENNMIKLSNNSWQKPQFFVDEFKEILLFENIESSKDLYDKMYAHSIQRDDDYHKILKHWKQRTGFRLFDSIFERLSEARNFYKSEFIDVDLLERKNSIKTKAKEIQTMLEIKLK